MVSPSFSTADILIKEEDSDRVNQEGRRTSRRKQEEEE